MAADRRARLAAVFALAATAACTGGGRVSAPAPGPLTLAWETRPALPPSPEGRWIEDLDLPEGHLVLAFGVPGVPEDAAAPSLRVRAEVVRGELRRAVLDVPWRPARGWREWTVPVPRELAGEGRVVLTVSNAGGLVERLWRGPVPARAAVPVAVPARAPDDPPSLVLISVDTLRADRLGCYGNPRDASPAVDRMAREGVRFPFAVAPSGWTLPSHYSMLSSLYPSVHGVNPDRAAFGGYRDPLGTVRVRGSGREAMLAERLAARGYLTAAITEDGWVHPRFGFDQGFASFVAEPGAPLASTRERTLTWLSDHRDLRFLLFVHTYQPHQPYDAPRRYQSAYVDERHVGYGIPGLEVPVDVLQDFRPGLYGPMAADVEAFRGLYDAEVRYVDDFVADLLAMLDEAGLAERTVVVLTSDHGEEIFEHGRFDHGAALYDEVMRVPLIFWGPGRIAPGGRPAAPASLLDVVPTLVELAGGRVEPPVQGRSLVPWLRSPDAAPVERDLFAEGFGDESRAMAAMWRGPWKYILTEGEPRREELYDRVADPGERVDRSRSHPEAVAAMREAVGAWRRECRELGRAFGAGEVEIDDALRERLRSLGYLD